MVVALLPLLGAGTPALILEADAVAAQIAPLDEEVDEAPGLGDITGSPEPGPAPEDAGDRGGLAQLSLAIILIGAVVFIASRVILAARARGGA